MARQSIGNLKLFGILALLITAGAPVSGIAPAYAAFNAPAPQAPKEFHEVEAAGCGAARGKLYRGARLGAASLVFVAGLGVQTIVNLENSASEVARETTYLQGLGLSGVVSQVFEPMPGFGVPQTVAGREDHDSVIRKIRQLRQRGDRAVYVHCQHGKDRTGLIVALHRVFNECWDAERAEAEWTRIQGPLHGFFQQAMHGYFQRVTDPGSELYAKFQRALAAGDGVPLR